jgi:hypothetical protein
MNEKDVQWRRSADGLVWTPWETAVPGPIPYSRFLQWRFWDGSRWGTTPIETYDKKLPWHDIQD